MSKFIKCITLILLCAGVVSAGVFEREYLFQPVQVENDGTYDILSIENLRSYGKPGAPLLPYKAVTILLPAGEEIVNVQVIDTQWEVLGVKTFPRPGSPVAPLSSREQAELTANPEYYNSESFYPSDIISSIQNGFLRGYGLGNFLLHPVRWNPQTGDTEQLSSIKLEITTESTYRAVEALDNLKTNYSTVKSINSITDDVENLRTYSNALDELDEIPGGFLIICDEAQSDVWAEYVQFKNSRGMVTTLLTTQDIYAEYAGVDNAEKVRNAIIDYYQNHDVEAVLLAGDVSDVPYRGFYIYDNGYTDYNMPSDLYFAGLDGTWNDDGDDRWGEVGEDDLYQEIIIGRAPTTNDAMVETWISKQIMFQTEPVVDEITQAIMVGEDLGWVAWGGEYKDEVRLGSTNHGYTTEGFSDDWTVGTLYDMDAIWTVPQLFADLNAGVTYVNHLGHANVTYALKATNPDINETDLTNDGINHNFYLGYSQGCYCGAFEQNSICELWTTIETGAFAFIANSRYGWGNLYDTDGPSQHYDREFFDAIFGEEIYMTGDANRDSKHDNIPIINEACMRWCFYEITLFGDPTIDLYSGPVETMTVNAPPAFVIGEADLNITVQGLEGAIVAVSQDNVLLSVAETDANGLASVPMEIPELGSLQIVITAHNYLPFESEILVINPDGMYPIVNSWMVDDAAGNGDGIADYGEDFGLQLVIENVGTEVVDVLDVTATSASEWLNIDADPVTVENILPGETATISIPSDVSVMVPDGNSAAISVTMTGLEDTWQQDFGLTLHAPDPGIDFLTVNDEVGGNGNHRFDSGETGTISIRLNNDGSSAMDGATFNVHIDDPNLQSVTSALGLVNLAANDMNDYADAIELEVSGLAPGMERAWILCELTLPNGYSWSAYVYVDIGGVYDDLEGIDQGWSHYANPDWDEQWHVSTDRNWTPGGTQAWKMGDDAGGLYINFLDACLELPVIDRDGSVKLSFWHWMDAETSNYWQGECYDGGIVEKSTDGVTWEVITMPGYNYLTRGDTGPLPLGIMVYSGQIDWTQEEVIIEGTGDLYLRFRFGTDQGIVNEGWYLDNISVSLPSDLTPPSGLEAELVGDVASLNWNTPGGQAMDLELLGFTVLRDGNPLTGVIQQTSFEDDLSGLPQGTYMYSVIAVYSGGESDAAGPVLVNYGESTISLMAIPVISPIEIGAGGGNFMWSASMTELSGSPQIVDCWTELVLPNGTPYGPLLLIENVNLAASQTIISGALTQYVPGFAPAGLYSYVANVGDYPGTIIAQDDFDFTKLAGAGPLAHNNGWAVVGWDAGETTGKLAMLPTEYSVEHAYPNPFNPQTTVSVALPDVSELRISVFNLLGQEVVVLGNGLFEAGYHSFTFDGQGMASGIYFIQADIPGKLHQVQKVMLMK